LVWYEKSGQIGMECSNSSYPFFSLSLSLSLKAEDVFKDTNTHSTIPVLKRYGPIDGVEVGSIGYSDGKICYNLQQSRIIIC